LLLILAIALVLMLLAVGFIGLFRRLASRFDAGQCTAEWLDEFSLDSYAPMERLFEKGDVEFLASQSGYRPAIAKRLMAERRKIFSAYLENVVQDFNQLVGIGKLLIVYSAQDQQEFARQLWRQQLRFYAVVCLLRLQLTLQPFGWNAIDPHSLVTAMTAMRERVQTITSPGLVEFSNV
jgi:hypothetical protein